MCKAILCGPFFCSFEKELTMFRPFFYWVKEKYNLPTYICSYNDHKFLYLESEFLNINSVLDTENIVFDETTINKKWINKIVRSLKHTISQKLGIAQKDINNFTITQNTLQISDEFKKYTKINTCILPENYDIVCILDKNNLEYEYTYTLINSVMNNINLKIKLITDESTEEIYNLICNCKLCITDISQWLFLCNLQNIQVFGWTDTISKFKNNELWFFNNKKSYIFSVNYKEVLFYRKILQKQLSTLLNKINN